MENRTAVTNTSSGSFAFGIFVELIFIWTILGNLIIIAVLKLYKPLTTPDILVFSLALSDLLNVLLPAQILNIIQSQFFNISWSKSICAAFTGSVYCLRLSSVLTVSVISLDRLLAIRKPLLYRSRVMHEIGRVKVLILVLWLFSCLTALLPFIGAGEWSFKGSECPYQLLDLGVYYGFYVEILGLLQLALVLYCYVVIRITTWHFLKRQGKFRRAQLDRTLSNQPVTGRGIDKVATKAPQIHLEGPSDGNANSQSAEHRRNSSECGQKLKRGSFIRHFGSKRRESTTPFLTEGMKQVAKMEKMMAVLVFLFYLSWIPFLGSNFYSLLTKKSNKNVTKVIGVFSLINGFLNPIVYATIYPRYRKGYLFVLRSILHVCGGEKPSITSADFNSSKIGRSRRLQTLKELKSISSTTRENATPQLRQGWLHPTSSTVAIITEEQKIEMQSVGDSGNFSSSINESLRPSFAGGEDDIAKISKDMPSRDPEDSTSHISVECIIPNCIKCKEKQAKGIKHESRNVVSPTFIRIANLNSSESMSHIKNSPDLAQGRQFSRSVSPHQKDSQSFANSKLAADLMPRDSLCTGRIANNSSKAEIGNSSTIEEHGKSTGHTFRSVENCSQILDAFEETKKHPDRRKIHEKCYQFLPNGAYLNDGFAES